MTKITISCYFSVGEGEEEANRGGNKITTRTNWEQVTCLVDIKSYINSWSVYIYMMNNIVLSWKNYKETKKISVTALEPGSLG